MQFAGPADHYDRFMGRYTPTLAVALADAAGVTAGMHVVDVGCGPGGLATELAARVGAENVAAIDPAAQFAAVCRERNPGADVREGVAEALPWSDATFDAALSSLVIGFMGDPDRGVSEMARVTRPGGTVAACMWDTAGGGMKMLDYVRRARGTPGAPSRWPVFAGRSRLVRPRQGQTPLTYCADAAARDDGPGDAAPSPTLRSQHVEATRRAVLAAARASFGSKGYAQTSVDEIAAAARVTKGAVYHHFSGKEALFRAVWTEVEAEATARAASAGDPDSPPIEQLVTEVDAYLEVALDEEVRQITLIDGPVVLGLEPRAPSSSIPATWLCERSSPRRSIGANCATWTPACSRTSSEGWRSWAA